MKIGETESDKHAKLSLECRQIVKSIVDFGVNEWQKLQIIQLIAMELEDREKMVLIKETVDSLKEEDSSSPKLLT
jgi:hypothetical protein